MESLVEYAKKAKRACAKYIEDNGLDNLSNKVYAFIQNIECLDKSNRDFLDKFISDTFSEKHLADVTYIGDGKESIFAALLRMKPIRLSQTDGRIYEARGDSFDFVLQSNSGRAIKVFQKVKF